MARTQTSLVALVAVLAAALGPAAVNADTISAVFAGTPSCMAYCVQQFPAQDYSACTPNAVKFFIDCYEANIASCDLVNQTQVAGDSARSFNDGCSGHFPTSKGFVDRVFPMDIPGLPGVPTQQVPPTATPTASASNGFSATQSTHSGTNGTAPFGGKNGAQSLDACSSIIAASLLLLFSL